MLKRLLVYALLPMMLVGCALNDIPGTPSIPVTVQPPPAMILAGECANTKELENWLEITTQLLDQFQSGMNEAITKGREALYTDIQNLIALRDATYLIAAPDCTTNAHVVLTDNMNTAVLAFQDYYNGKQPNINATLVSVNARFDDLRESQKTLIQQMTMQFQNPTPTPAS